MVEAAKQDLLPARRFFHTLSDSEPTGTGLDKTPTYQNLLNAGFEDAWSQAGFGPVFTCCQADDLLNEDSMLNERIDIVLFRREFTVTDANILGEQHSDRAASGLGRPITQGWWRRSSSDSPAACDAGDAPWPERIRRRDQAGASAAQVAGY